MKSGAIIEDSYRYLLWREWDKGDAVAFIMLNPSRADAEVNDPTIRRCINFAKSFGYGRLEVVNLFAYRTAKPALLKEATEPIGKENNRYIQESVSRCGCVILAWGNHGSWLQRDIQTVELLKNHPQLYCLGMTKRGLPRHPLYLKKDTSLQRYFTKQQP